MKQLALNQLQEAIRILNYTLSDINPNTVENAKEDIKHAIEQINGAIYSETPSTSRKFDLYKIAANDELRPALCGVFHNDGFKVSCDSHVLVAVKDTYDESLEGHILDKTGKDIIAKYPRWKDLIQKKEEGDGVFTIDTSKIYELVKAHKVEKKAAGKYGPYRLAYVKVGDAYFPVERMAKLALFMDAYGTTEIHIKDRRRAAACYAPDGSVAIIMPVLYSSSYRTKDGQYHGESILPDVWEQKRDDMLWYEVA